MTPDSQSPAPKSLESLDDPTATPFFSDQDREGAEFATTAESAKPAMTHREASFHTANAGARAASKAAEESAGRDESRALAEGALGGTTFGGISYPLPVIGSALVVQAIGRDFLVDLDTSDTEEVGLIALAFAKPELAWKLAFEPGRDPESTNDEAYLLAAREIIRRVPEREVDLLREWLFDKLAALTGRKEERAMQKKLEAAARAAASKASQMLETRSTESSEAKAGRVEESAGSPQSSID